MVAAISGKVSGRGSGRTSMTLQRVGNQMVQVPTQAPANDSFDAQPAQRTNGTQTDFAKTRDEARRLSMSGMAAQGQRAPDPSGNAGASALNFSPLNGNAVRNAAQLSGLRNSNDQLGGLDDLGGAGGTFEDRVFALMCKVVEDMQKEVEERLNKLEAEAKAAEASQAAGGGGGGEQGGGGGGNGQESRNIEFEKIKFDMQKLSQMQQAMSNVLNTMDELAKSAIRNIKMG